MDITRKNWFDEKGDETLALDWPLNENSHVWEIGGFEGRWAAQIVEKFHCHMEIFEPQPWAIVRLQEKFDDNPKVNVNPFGLWIQDGFFRMGAFGSDGASMMATARTDIGLGHFKYFEPVLNNFTAPIDLALMNIEGAEYFLLPAWIHKGLIGRFDYFWCQFHLEQQLAVGQSGQIMDLMSASHDLLWDCFPTAVAWKRKA